MQRQQQQLFRRRSWRKEEEGRSTWSPSGTCLPGRWSAASPRPTGMRLLLLAALLLLGTLTTGAGGVMADQLVHRLLAPAIVDPRKDHVMLSCEYDLKDLELYAVSWYRNDKMLFKYTPSSQPSGQFFEQPDNPDVRVSVEQSNSHRLVLLGHQDVRKNMQSYEGTYTCEVSTEQPFYSDYAMANITTAILPTSNLTIDGLAPNYNVGEQLDATCISAPSLPAADLSLYLNDQKIDESRIQREKTRQAIGVATISSRLTFSLQLERYHFHAGVLKLTCRASLPGVPVRDYRAEKTATLGASNQRLAQELPKLYGDSSAPRGDPLLLLFLLPLILVRVHR